MVSRIAVRRRSAVLAGTVLVAGSASLYLWVGFWPAAALLGAGVVYLDVMLGQGALAHFQAMVPLSLRWKIPAALSLMLGILLGVSLVALAAANSMHDDVHSIQQLIETAPRPEVVGAVAQVDGPQGEIFRQMQVRFEAIPAALDRMEERQHMILTWVPMAIFGGGLVAVALAFSISSFLVRPIQRMSEATSRIARGDFSQPVDVTNRDEIGQLGQGLNSAAKDLERLQEAILAEERARSVQARMAQASLSQEEERRRISRELHDGLGPSLADISNRLSISKRLVRSDPLKAEEVLDEATTLLRGHIAEVRELINQLRPLAIDQLGLSGALRQYIEGFGGELGIDVTMAIPDPVASDPLTEATIYRVVQESLMNVRKHAHATTVDVTVEPTEEHLRITVSDNGRGFDAAALLLAPATGYGLTSMRERAELIGGAFVIHSKPGEGTKAVLEVPARG